jgi:alkyl sulfatase BDS1-like metallo-beta-lactamase superfamily hydrolase
MAATPLDKFLDLLATTVVPERAGDQRLTFNLVESISGDRFAITLGNAVLVSEKNQALPDAPTLTAPKPVLLGILFGQAPLDAMLAAGQARVEGDPAAIRQLVPMLEQPRLDFAIIEP